MPKFEYHTFLHHSQTNSKVYCAIISFEYHTFLHHSQTVCPTSTTCKLFEYHTFLHHSQTQLRSCGMREGLSTIHFYIILKPLELLSPCQNPFEYHTFLHHSQTFEQVDQRSRWFEYHTFLHHSQTSNSKMKCHHSHKIQVLKLLGCYISHPSLSIIYLVTPSMQSLAQVSINKS